jgi:hypothetical protein
MSPLQRGQRSVSWILAQRGSANSIDCCCVTANAVSIDASFSDKLTTLHDENEWQLAFQKVPAQPESSMSMKNRGDG